MKSTPWMLGIVGLGAAALVGCTGSIAGGPGAASSGADDPANPEPGLPPPPDRPPIVTPPGTPVPSACATTVSPGRSPVRRLTRFEYNNTVRDLLGDTTRPADKFPPEEIGNGFGNDADALTVSRLLAEQYQAAAQGIAARLQADAVRWRSTLGCDPAAGNDACAASFVATFGARAYRRPLLQAERDRLLAVYRDVRAREDFGTAAGAVLQVMLQAPQFLYRVEIGVPVPSSSGTSLSGASGLYRPDHFEMASRLSYLFWGTMPDATLFAAAQAGALGTPEEIKAQAARLIADPKARDIVRYFHQVLYGLAGIDAVAKSQTLYPQWTPEIPGLLQQEANLFLDDVVWSGPGDLGSLLSAPYSFMNARLAQYYGVAGRPNAPRTAQFQRIDLDPARAGGIVTQGGFLASLTSGINPPLRGSFVRRAIMCSPPPDPPAGAVEMAPANLDPGLTMREETEVKTAAPACAGCHALINPIGFALENFDSTGRWRDTDKGKPVNARAVIAEDDGVDIAGPVDGAAELARKLGGSVAVGACYSGRWLTYAYGRAETAEDQCTRLSLQGAFAAANGKIRDFLVALTQTDAFLYRSPVAP